MEEVAGPALWRHSVLQSHSPLPTPPLRSAFKSYGTSLPGLSVLSFQPLQLHWLVGGAWSRGWDLLGGACRGALTLLGMGSAASG